MDLEELKEKLNKIINYDFNSINTKKLSYEENIIFFDGLYELIKSGIPLIKCLDIIHIKNKNLLRSIKNNIENGMALSQCLLDTKAFENTAIAIVETGEKTGNIDIAFEKLSKYYKHMNELKNSLILALFYPVILVICILGLIFFINYYFIPQIMSLYSYDIEKLNFFTRSMFQTSAVLNKYKAESIIMIVSIILLLYLYVDEMFLNRDENNILFKIPVISKVFSIYVISNIIWNYYIMLSGGVDILNATTIVKQQTKNRFVRNKLSVFEKSINSGKSITNSIEQLELSDENIAYFISVGEQSGNIDRNLKILSDMYGKNFKNGIKYITQIIQPVLIVIITFIVGVIITQIILPILQNQQSFF